jgi:hypothetical protein
VQLDAFPLLALPATFHEGPVSLGNVARLGQHQCHGVLGGRQDIRLRGIDHHHAATRGRFHVHIVEAYASAPDRNQIAAGLEHIGTHTGSRADDESGGPGDSPEELVGGKGKLDVDLVARCRHYLEPARR